MSDTKTAKKRMSPSQWAEARAMWASGEFTLEQIAEKYGVARETLSRRFTKDGVKKGQSQIDRKVEQELIEKAVQAADKWAERGEQARESFFKMNKMVVALTGKVLQDAIAGGKGLYTAQADLKALQMTSIILEKTRANQWAVVGLDKETDNDDEIPQLLVRTLTPDQVAELHRMQHQPMPDEEIEIGDAEPYLEDLDELDDDEDDVIVEEADD